MLLVEAVQIAGFKDQPDGLAGGVGFLFSGRRGPYWVTGMDRVKISNQQMGSVGQRLEEFENGLNFLRSLPGCRCGTSVDQMGRKQGYRATLPDDHDLQEGLG